MMGLSATRLYGSAIAIVSGIYAIGSSTMANSTEAMGIGGWIMLATGIAALVHGVILLTPTAGRLMGVSGPLMIVWSAVMLINQALLGGMSMGNAMQATMSWDPGMVAIAALMLISGLIMTRAQSQFS